MKKQELLELIANGENSGVEFKLDTVRPEQLAKEVVALANLKGGHILLGVADDKSIAGITREQLLMLGSASGYIHAEIMPVQRTSFDVLDRSRLENYLREILKDPDVPETRDEWIARLKALGYSDRLEITSPGSLPNSMTVEKMLAGQRSARNPIIVEVLRDYGYVDARGMGIRAKVVPALKTSGASWQVEATEDFVKMTVGKATAAAFGTGERPGTALKLVSERRESVGKASGKRRESVGKDSTALS